MASGPKYVGTKTEPNTFQEFVNVYHDMPNKAITPRIYISAGAPSFTPQRVGDIDISTTTGKVYISTASATSGSWAVMN